jgi:hypothetical protein
MLKPNDRIRLDQRDQYRKEIKSGNVDQCAIALQDTGRTAGPGHPAQAAGKVGKGSVESPTAMPLDRVGGPTERAWPAARLIDRRQYVVQSQVLTA